jgi:hypothetical protein
VIDQRSLDPVGVRRADSALDQQPRAQQRAIEELVTRWSRARVTVGSRFARTE